MSKKKGKSAQEKEDIILGVYHELKEVYNLAEVEKLAVSRGVVQQSVKDINMQLVHDSKVCMDKMGSGNFFWSFPSKQFMDRVTKLEALQRQEAHAQEMLKAAQDAVALATSQRCADGRQAKLQRIQELEHEEQSHDATIEANKKNDPEVIASTRKAADACKLGAERWTDNIWSIKAYLVKKRNMDGKTVDQMLGITDDFDYPDWAQSKLATGKKAKKK